MNNKLAEKLIAPSFISTTILFSITILLHIDHVNYGNVAWVNRAVYPYFIILILLTIFFLLLTIYLCKLISKNG